MKQEANSSLFKLQIIERNHELFCAIAESGFAKVAETICMNFAMHSYATKFLKNTVVIG